MLAMDDDVLDDLETQSGESSATRTIANIIKRERPESAPLVGEAVYGDTDLNPNVDDQREMHAGKPGDLP